MSSLTSLTDPGLWLVAIGIAAIVFGFLPGVFARLIARVYPRGDPRRDEMVAELYAVPRAERPVWVGEQLERMLHEAVPARIRHIRTARFERREITVRWRRDVLELKDATRVGFVRTQMPRHLPLYPGAMAFYSGGRVGDPMYVVKVTRVTRRHVFGSVHIRDGNPSRIVRFPKRFVVSMLHRSQCPCSSCKANGRKRALDELAAK